MFNNWFKKKSEVPVPPTLPSEITVYGTSWCGDSRRCRNILTAIDVPYVWVDIDKDKEGETFVRQVNHGNRSVPTIVFNDGRILVEPSESELTAALRALSGPTKE